MAARKGGVAGRAVKRVLDVILATTALVLLLPVIGLVAIAIRVQDGPPVLFRQMRPGLRGRPFRLTKFRTMRVAGPDERWYATDAQRVTRIGRILRATSLDELPELWNVLRGEMSIVGPRPLLAAYEDVYTPEERRRHLMRPGLTSWAIVNGRHDIAFEERLQLDVWYVDNWSLALDLRIIRMTIVQLLRRESVATVQDLGRIEFPERFRVALEHASDAGTAVGADVVRRPPER